MQTRKCRNLGAGLALGVAMAILATRGANKYWSVAHWASDWWHGEGRRAVLDDLAPSPGATETDVERMLLGSIRQSAAQSLALSHYIVVWGEQFQAVRNDQLRSLLGLLPNQPLSYMLEVRLSAEEQLFPLPEGGRARLAFYGAFNRRFLATA